MDINEIDPRCEQSVNVFAERDRLLELGGFILVRQGKHLIFKNERGFTIVISGSPSDHRACRNDLAQIRRTLRSMGVIS